MAEAQANINLNLNTSGALAQLRALQRQISLFQQQMARGNANTVAQAQGMQRNLLNSINSTGQFAASMTTVSTATESFTSALQKNKLSMGEYFRFAGGASKNFGRFFRNEMNLVGKVARERVKDLQTQYIKMGRDTNGAMRAMAVRPLTLDMENLATRTAMAAQKQQIFNQLIRQGSTNLLNWGKNTQWAGRQLMVGFTIPLGIMGATAISEFRKLEEQAVKFRRVYGDMFTTSAETEKALDNIRELADEFTKYGIAVEKTIDLAAKVAQMGNMGDALEQQVTQATRLAVLGGLEQQEALDTTISLTNAFGVATEDLASKIAFLNAAENQTILAIEDFNEAIPKAGSVVQQLGGDVEDLAFFLTAMREGGINASQGANALKSSLGRLVNPTEVARKKMAELGIDIVGIVENNVGDLRGTIMELGYELDALAPLDRSRAIEQMFGKFQFARMSTMFQNIVKDGSQAQKVLELTTNSSEELAILAERELARVEESPAFKLQKSFEQLKASLAPLGEQFVKIVTPIIEFGTNILEKFNAMGEGGKRFATIAIASLGLVAPAALMIIGLIANGVANLAKFFTMLMSVGKQGSTSMTQLGAQTQYMTQEQIEASAVAASLNNSHERLRQTFTSEAAAVRNLTTAYQQGIGAQRAFAFGPGRGPARGRTASGFAEGVVSVPGPKGAGDIIPAMLSPGEAVIPAKMAEKYAPFISQMIEGTVPGFIKGTFLTNKQVADEKFYSAPRSVSQQASEMPAWSTEAAEDEFLERLAAEEGLSEQQTKQLKRRQTSHIEKDTSPVEIGGQKVEMKNWKADNLMLDKGAVNNFQNSLEQSGGVLKDLSDSDIGNIAKEAGTSFKDTKKTLEKFDKGIAPATKKEAKIMQKVAERKAAEADAAYKAEEAKKRPNQRNLSRLRNQRYQARAAAGVLQERLKAPTGKGFYDTKDQRSYDPKKDAKADQEQKRKVDSLNRKNEKLKEENSKAIKKNTRSKKNSTRATDKNTAATQKEEAATKRSVAAKKGWETRRARAAATSAASAPRDLSGVTRLTSRQPVLAYAGGMPETSPAPAAPGRFKRFMSVGKGSGGMGIAMGASALAMGGSMLPGQIGQTVQKLMPAIMGISMLAPMIGMLGAPLTALIAVVGGLTAAYFLHKKAIEDTAKETYELQRALGTSRTAVQSLAEEAGRVTDRELVERQQQDRFDPFQIAAGKTTFGENFAEGEAGQELVSNIRTSLTDLGRDQTVISVFQQLGQAVGEGALSIPEARSIATELGDQIDDMSFGMEVNANLMRLLGPGGEDLTAGDRLTILADLREDRERTREEMDLDYEATSYGDIFDAESEANERLGEIIEQSGSMLGAMATSGEAWKIWWGAITGTTAAQDNIKQMSTILAQGVNDADAYASEMAAIEVAYGEDLEKAYAMGDQYEISRLEREKSDAQRELVAQRKQDQDQILSELGEDTSKARIAMKQALEVDFAGDEAALAQYQGALKQIQELGLSDQKSLQLEYMLTSGDMEFSTAMAIVENYEKLPKVSNKILEIQTKLGGDFGKNASDLFNIFNDLDEALAEEFVLSLDTRDLDEYQRQIEGFGAISRITNLFPEGEEILLDLALKDPSVLDGIVERTSRIEALDNEQITLDFIANTFGDEALAAAETIWSDIPKEDRKDALYSILTALDLQMGEGFDDLFSSLEGQTIAGVTISEPGDILSLIGARTSGIAQGNREAGDGEDEIEAAGGSAKKLTSIMDDLVKKLRDVRLSTILMTNGWVESANKLEELFGGGRGISVFRGLEQEMRSLGAGEDLIDLIVGMDPEEFEKKKDQLFTFDAAGNITGATNILANMGKALDAIALGDFQSEQEKVVRTISDQIIATRKLTAAGFSQVEAYEAVQDAAFAAAVAQEKNKDVIRQLVNVTKEAKEMTEAFAAAQAVASSNQEFVDRGNAIDFIAKNIENLTEAQKQLIMSDSNVQALIGTTVDAKALRQALANAEKEAQLELRIKKLTFEGQIDIFEEGFSNAMEAFAVQEKEIELDFKIKKQPLIDAIEAAERQIQDIRDRPGGLDDLEADLSRISDKEEELNERYDERIKALEEVKSINEAVAKLQQNQLDVAEALSRGDIAAAAKAAQQRRQQSASIAVENQSKQIELQRETELANLTAKTGLNRKQLEESIKTLKDEIFEIEERTIEPAQYRLELLEREQQELIDGVTVLGKTRDEWERIKNNIDLAKISSDSFQQTMQEALDIVESIVNYWNDFDPDPKEIQITEKVVEEREPLEPVATVVPKDTQDGTGPGTEKEEEEEKEEYEWPGEAVGWRPPMLPGYDPNAPSLPGIRPWEFRKYGPQNPRQADGSFPEEEAGRRRRNNSFDVLGGVPEGYYQKPGTDPGPFGDPALALTEYEKRLLGQAGSSKTNINGSDASAGGTGGYDPLTGRYNPQSSIALPGGGPAGVPSALSGGQDFNAIVSQITQGLSAKLQQVQNDTAETTRVMLQHFGQFGITAPILMQTIPNFINKIPEQSRVAILENVQGHFNTLSINAKETLNQIPDFFTRLPEISQQALLEQMNSQFGQFSNQALTDLGGINEWISALPADAQVAAWDILSQQISKLAVDAEGNLNETIFKFFDVLPENVQGPIVEELGAQIQTMAKNAGMSVDQYITTKLKDLPEETKQMLVDGIQGNITEASEGSAEAITTYIPGGLNEVSESGSTTASGIEEDFENASISAVENIETIKTPFEALAAYISDDGNEGFTGILNKAFDDAKNNGVSAAGDIKDAFGSAGRKFASEFKGKFSDLLDKLEGVRVDGEKIDIDRNGFNKGGLVPGIGSTDIIPASLTPGEFVITKFATKNFGIENLQAINDGKFPVAAIDVPSSKDISYNNSYQINVNVKSDANPEDIARTVVQNIKRVDSQRVRGNRI